MKGGDCQMQDKPDEQYTDRAAAKGHADARRDRGAGAIGAGQMKTLTRPPSDAAELMAADADEEIAALPAAPRNAAAAALSSPGAAGKTAAAARGRPRGSSRRPASQAQLAIARVEPWPVMKFAFVVSLAAFVILFAAVSVVYGTLSALGVFDSLQHFMSSITSSQFSAGVNARAWFSASRVLGCTALLGALNIVLITAMSTIGAVVYNLTSRLVGGVEVTVHETH